MAQADISISSPTRFIDRLFMPSNPLPLVWMRMLFGVLILWEVSTFFRNKWIFSLLQEPKIHFPYPGFDWVSPLDGKGMELVFYLLGLAALCVTIGFLYRFAIVVVTVLFAYIFLLDSSYYLNHYYLFVLLGILMSFVQANGQYSVDARIWPERFRRNKVATWQLYLILGQLGIVYFFGGIAKLSSPDWLAGQPAGLWLAEHTDLPLIGGMLGQAWFAVALAWVGTFMDLLIFPALLWRKTRIFGVILGITFHLINSFWFNIGGFPWFMIGAMLCFWPGDILQNWLDQITGKKKLRKKVATSTFPGSSPTLQKLVIAGMTIWFAVQIILPVRHFFIPGDVAWTYEGHRFSWRMKLVDRQSEGIAFSAINLDTQEKTAVNHRLYMNPRQYAKLGTDNYKVLQFAQFAKLELAKMGFPNVAIYASSNVSLNGRPAVPFIDPSMNLLEVSPGAPSPLILPRPDSPLP